MTLCLIVSRMCKNNSTFCSLAEEKKMVYTQIYGVQRIQGIAIKTDK